jgi:hypothetical protein
MDIAGVADPRSIRNKHHAKKIPAQKKFPSRVWSVFHPWLKNFLNSSAAFGLPDASRMEGAQPTTPLLATAGSQKAAL